MKRRLCFDFETNGLIGQRDDLKILCGAAQNVDTLETFTWADDFVVRETGGCAWELLASADELIGHNIAGFDMLLIDMFAPKHLVFTTRIYDTIASSRAKYFTNMVARSAAFRNKYPKSQRETVYPSKYLVPYLAHNLAAWGYRLKCFKGDYLEEHGVQEEFSEGLLEYCLQDVVLNTKVWVHLTTKPAFPGAPCDEREYEAMVVESQTVYWLEIQRANGVRLDERAAGELAGVLADRREQVIRTLQTEYFPDYYVADGKVQTSKRTARSRSVEPGEPGFRNVEAGCQHQKIKKVTFTGTRFQIINRLQTLYGWKVTEESELAKDGFPKVKEEVLKGLPYPCAPLLAEQAMLKHRLGQLSEGNKSYLKMVGSDGIIHGRCDATGARTGRMAHSSPNMNVPKPSSPYGPECRALFSPTRDGWVQVGADASGLQLRCLGHRLGRYDDGEFAEILLTGDPHEAWRAASGLFIRDNQKTLTYAFLFGAGNGKLGSIVLHDWRMAVEKGITEEPVPDYKFQASLGENARKGLLRQVAGLDPLLRDCEDAFKRGWLVGLDGRVIKVASKHGALNDLLQGDEAVIMKHAWQRFIAEQVACEFRLHEDWAPMLYVHDEWQNETRPEVAEQVGENAVMAFREAGEKLNLRIALDGEYKVGANWMETH